MSFWFLVSVYVLDGLRAFFFREHATILSFGGGDICKKWAQVGGRRAGTVRETAKHVVYREILEVALLIRMSSSVSDTFERYGDKC